jgi:L-asparaginase
MSKRVITTGGTIDKVYMPTTGELVFDRTHVPEMLQEGRLRLDLPTVEELMLVDSLYMTDEQRDMIVESTRQARETAVVITHGTDTMVETARRIKESLLRDIGEKTIVLTGAMVPFSINRSDALFNLGSALAYANCLSPGVYIAMNGNYFEADTVMKNRKLGTFVSKEG